MEWRENAAQSVLRFGRIELIFDGLIETAVEEDGVVVASAHHLLPCVPLNSCMCRIEALYTGLLNDATWCMELFHCW